MITENLSFPFLSQGGDCGALMRAMDWTGTGLGHPDTWPETLKITLRLVLTSSRPMLLWWGPHLIQFYNDAYMQILTQERHPSALGQPGKKCWEEIWDVIEPQIKHVMGGGGGTWNEEQLVPINRDGRKQDAWWTYGYSPIEDNQGIRGVLVLCDDVTVQHQAREALQLETHRRKKSEQKFRSYFTQAPGFMAILRGPEHIYEFVSAAYTRLIGERPFVGLPIRAVLPALDGQEFFETLDNVYKSGKVHCAYDVLMTVTRHGETTLSHEYVDFVYQPITDEDGSVSGIFVQGADATERHLAKEALITSEARLKEGLIAAQMAVWDLDLESKRFAVSDNAHNLFGCELKSEESFWKSVHPEDINELKSSRDAASAECTNFESMVRFIRPDNGKMLWVHVSGKAACSPDGVSRQIQGVFLDVTMRKEAEISLAEANRRKDEFLAMLAHELRNPLAPISTAATLLKAGTPDAHRLARTSEIITRQVRHMTGLINDLLDVSRVTTGIVHVDKQLLDIRQVIDESIEQALPSVQARRHQFEYRKPDETISILGDHTRLVQVLTNLLQNSAKYTSDGGKIGVIVKTLESEVAVSVTDNGAGIDNELLPHVFDLFTQAKRSSDRSEGGLGLGLALVKSLVGLHGGRVEAVSEGRGRGSTFTVTLPMIATGPATDEGQNTTGPAALHPKRLRLLVVDDNTDAADTLGMFLEAAGHEVEVKYEPLAALEQVRSKRYDVFVLDIGLPGIDGNELARQLRTLPSTSQATLIALTGYGAQFNKETSISAGFDYYFVKPASAAELVELLNEVDSV